MKKGILLTNSRSPTDHELTYWSTCGYKVYYHALLSVEFLPVKSLNITPQAIILTSANGAVALKSSDWDRTIPVYGVGKSTVIAAKAAGFLNCLSPSNEPYPSALNLINWIKENLNPKKGTVVFGCGKHIRHDIAKKLTQSRFITKKIILYKTQPITFFSEHINAALKNNCISSIVINSEQALRAFLSLCQTQNLFFQDFSLMVSSDYLKNVAINLGFQKSETIKNY